MYSRVISRWSADFSSKMLHLYYKMLIGSWEIFISQFAGEFPRINAVYYSLSIYSEHIMPLLLRLNRLNVRAPNMIWKHNQNTSIWNFAITCRSWRLSITFVLWKVQSLLWRKLLCHLHRANHMDHFVHLSVSHTFVVVTFYWWLHCQNYGKWHEFSGIPRLLLNILLRKTDRSTCIL